jgi:hypothetical protein
MYIKPAHADGAHGSVAKKDVIATHPDRKECHGNTTIKSPTPNS